MGRLGAMVRKDLMRQLRSPLAVGLTLAFPVVLAGLIALVFGTGGGSAVRKVELLVEDDDGSFVSGLLVSAAKSDRMSEHFEVRSVGADGRARLETGEASALLRIPEGFESRLLAGETVSLELVRNPSQGILPEIAEQAAIVLTDTLSAASEVLREPIADIATLAKRSGAPTLDDTLRIATAVHETIREAGKLVFPPAITVESVELDAKGGIETAAAAKPGTSFLFLLVLPGVSVWALFLIGDVGMRDVLTESVTGTLRRQLVSPIRPTQVVLAKALYTATLASIGVVLLASIGWLVGRRGIDPAAFVLLSAALVVASTGFASVIYGLARTERQGSTLSSIVLLVFAFLGGTFVQVDSLPAGARAVAPYTLFYWGTTGYHALIQDGAGLAAVLPNVGILVGTGVAMLAAGGWLLDRKARGAGA